MVTSSSSSSSRCSSGMVTTVTTIVYSPSVGTLHKKPNKLKRDKTGRRVRTRTYTNRQADTERDSQRERERQRQRHRKRQRETERERDSHSDARSPGQWTCRIPSWPSLSCRVSWCCVRPIAMSGVTMSPLQQVHTLQSPPRVTHSKYTVTSPCNSQ